MLGVRNAAAFIGVVQLFFLLFYSPSTLQTKLFLNIQFFCLFVFSMVHSLEGTSEKKSMKMGILLTPFCFPLYKDHTYAVS